MRTIDLTDESGRIYMPDDLSGVDDAELLDIKTAFDCRAEVVSRQIYEYNIGSLPDHLMTDEWISKALRARALYKKLSKRAGLETSQRQEQRKREKAEMKAANIARDAAVDDKKAFIRAAKQILSQEVYMSIWRLAREAHPEAFSGVEEVV